MFKIFRRKSKEDVSARIKGKPVYDYRVIDRDDVSSYSNAIHDLQERKYDGLLIKNALNEKQCNILLRNADDLLKDKGAEMPVGWAFPLIFAELINTVFREGEESGKQRMKDYFLKCKEIHDNSENYYGLNVNELIESWLTKFSGGLPIQRAKGYDNEGEYIGHTLRSYRGHGKGNISVHCGNWFQTVWKQFYGHLEAQVNVFDQLSYFFLLQKPESGGELSLYDFEWEEGQSKASNHENTSVKMANGEEIKLKNRRKMMIHPMEGDMIIFAGGQIWHRVEDVLGDKERITLGGFLSFSRDNQAVVYWS